MIGYVTLGTNDLNRAARFFDELLAVVGAKRVWDTDHLISWGTDPQQAMLGAITPFDGNKATPGNGTMVAIAAKNQEEVDRIYQKAITLGAKDEGPAGPRGQGFYAGYFRDLDGNKLCAYFMG